eukprot:1159503-Pelagomonas_calceolata.AAC.2
MPLCAALTGFNAIKEIVAGFACRVGTVGVGLQGPLNLSVCHAAIPSINAKGCTPTVVPKGCASRVVPHGSCLRVVPRGLEMPDLQMHAGQIELRMGVRALQRAAAHVWHSCQMGHASTQLDSNEFEPLCSCSCFDPYGDSLGIIAI